jgi:DNA replication and repair protein RecF
MQINRLSLTNFRNFARLEVEFPGGPTLLVGANAQGKTSLLEAIYYLTGAGTSHATSDRQLINFLALKESQPFARLVGEVQAHDRLHRLEIRLILENNDSERLNKEILINGLNKRQNDLASHFNAVLFLPQDLEIIEGSPSLRRRFMDVTISQADPLYGSALRSYSKVLSQRNALLKGLFEHNGSVDQLSFWDQKLCDLAGDIIRGRILALSEMERQAAPIHDRLTRSKETLRLDYSPSYDPLPEPEAQIGLGLETAVDRTGFSAQAIADGLRQALQDNRREEIQRGVTLIGPHRDDFRFLANGLDLRLYGSRGQIRTAMLSAKLAEVEWIESKVGEPPVVLLDEVLAELDTTRRRDLLESLGRAHQTVLTATDLSMFDPDFVAQATQWNIEGGRLTPVS